MHKAQGMTLQVANIEGSRVNFAHGQAYVAVSRCSTKSGLRVQNHRSMRVSASPTVKRYYEQAVRVSPSVLDGICVPERALDGNVDDVSSAVEHTLSDQRSVSKTNGTPECFDDLDFAGNRQGQDDGTGSLWSIVKAFGIVVVFVVLIVLLAAILFS
ncbi:MAG: hypothetical protein IH989_03355 [Planctomycetes bacterium]|nr:hypothetical protein [Planctomycetota bacterium]